MTTVTDDSAPVATMADLPRNGAMHVVQWCSREVLLCRSADNIYALDNACSHAAARLCEGRLRGDRVFCPLHGAAFDIRNGEALSRPASEPVACFRVEVRDADIYLMDAETD